LECWVSPGNPRDSALAPILPKAPSGGRRGKVLVFHDSFFIPMKPYFELEFREVKMIKESMVHARFGLTQEMLTVEKARRGCIEAVERVWTW